MPALAYYFSGFPALSETFVRSQVRASGELGLKYILVANRPPARMHPGDRPLAARTWYLSRVPPAAYVRATVKHLCRNPSRYLTALRRAREWAGGSPRHLAANLLHLAGAAYLTDFLARRGVVQVHVHYAFGAAETALFLKLLGGPPFSLSIHGSDVLPGSALLRPILEQARFVVSNCRYHIGSLRQRFPSLKTQRFYLVRGGVELDTGLWSRTCPPAPLPPLRLLMVGRLVPVKGHEVLLRAVARLVRRGLPLEVRLAGDGPEGPRLQALAAALGIAEQVNFLGALPEEEVAALYDWCHVAVLSSRSEGTPMTVIEAMAKARPVVAPRLTALPEMVVEGVTGFLFTPREEADLAHQLTRFLTHPDLIPRMGQAGRHRALKLFELKTNTRRFLALLGREVPALGLGELSNIN
jgi:colanic acid/amylovoran biosynthesis glycosyltransferase